MHWRIRALVAFAALVIVAAMGGWFELDVWDWSLESSWGWE